MGTGREFLTEREGGRDLLGRSGSPRGLEANQREANRRNPKMSEMSIPRYLILLVEEILHQWIGSLSIPGGCLGFLPSTVA